MPNKWEYMRRLHEEYEKIVKYSNNSERIKELNDLLFLRVNGRTYFIFDITKIVEKFIKNRNLKMKFFEVDFNNKCLIIHSLLSISDRVFKGNKDYYVKGKERIDYLPFNNFSRYKIDFWIGLEPICYGQDFMLYLEDMEFFSRMDVLNYKDSEFVDFEFLDYKGKVSVKFRNIVTGEIGEEIFDLKYVNQMLNNFINNKTGVIGVGVDGKFIST